MHLLPLSLGRLADHCPRAGGMRYVLDAVFLRVNPDNTFEAVATDTKVLIRVTGPCVADPASFPEIPEFDAKPDGATSALIPATFWKRAFTWARKLTGKSSGNNPSPKCVAVRIGETETAFAAGNERYQWCESTANRTGRFPSYENLLTAGSSTPRERIEVDPILLAGFFLTAAEFSSDPSLPSLTVETYGSTKPIRVWGKQPGGWEVVGVVMPLIPSSPPQQPELQIERKPDSEEVAELRTERDALAEKVRELKAALALARPSNRPETE